MADRSPTPRSTFARGRRRAARRWRRRRRRRRRSARGSRRRPRAASPAHSPVVAPALAASIVAGIRFADSSRGGLGERRRAPARRPPLSRSAFHRSSASIRSRSTSGSGVRMPPSSPTVSGESSVSVKRVLADHLELAGLDPRQPLAMGLDEARLHVGDGLAGVAPPCSATTFISSRAPSTSSATRPSITFEPSKMSG